MPTGSHTLPIYLGLVFRDFTNLFFVQIVVGFDAICNQRPYKVS